MQEGSKILNLESAKGGNTFLPASQCAKYELIVVARGWQESCVKCLSSTMLKKQRWESLSKQAKCARAQVFNQLWFWTLLGRFHDVLGSFMILEHTKKTYQNYQGWEPKTQKLTTRSDGLWCWGNVVYTCGSSWGRSQNLSASRGTNWTPKGVAPGPSKSTNATYYNNMQVTWLKWEC